LALQINRKYDFLGSAGVCIDLCAAPGGWCQVAAKQMPAESLILGVDLLPIRPIRNVKTLIHDITTGVSSMRHACLWTGGAAHDRCRACSSRRSAARR
jgi:23S rRNA U2552 (ribose-2'-O)-methylase RlmE/FtsJ